MMRICDCNWYIITMYDTCLKQLCVYGKSSMSWLHLLVREANYKLGGKAKQTSVNLRQVKKVVYDPHVSLKIALNCGESIRLTNQDYSSKELEETHDKIQQAINRDHK